MFRIALISRWHAHAQKPDERYLNEFLTCPDCKVTRTMDRAEALKGADGVLCTVFNGGIEIWRHDIEIPKKYGVDIKDFRKEGFMFFPH